jgi:hypothetical protein
MKSIPVCPVPTEQQPINEYQELRESWFFRWATLETWGYVKPLLILWAMSWAIAGPVANLSFPWSKFPMKFFLLGSLVAIVIPILALLQLGLGWRYVSDRLMGDEVVYEESGWYDGQSWTKPEEVLQRDRLIVTYQIQPLLQRIKYTFGILALLGLTGSITWAFL